jgi:DNA-binding CsgD family transcriptional regulator
MTSPAAHHRPATTDNLGARLASRGELTAFLSGLAEQVRADHYMLIAIVHDEARADARIIASNWMFDAIELVGTRAIAGLASGPLTVAPGMRPLPLVTAQTPGIAGAIGVEEARLLDALGHAEIYSLRIDAGRRRLFAIFSSTEAGAIEPDALTRTQLKCCYTLAQIPDVIAGAAMQDPLSDRERECLFWVSEGKTTDEVAVILGVSSNTVNSYITHAIQKFSASNRAMAIATAIRSGII